MRERQHVGNASFECIFKMSTSCKRDRSLSWRSLWVGSYSYSPYHTPRSSSLSVGLPALMKPLQKQRQILPPLSSEYTRLQLSYKILEVSAPTYSPWVVSSWRWWAPYGHHTRKARRRRCGWQGAQRCPRLVRQYLQEDCLPFSSRND
ncbi:hypothetical protein M011DRAFT_340423 [Sporormia fimetaria CBS 119925]|uniref:Uncharacterized protein n=1 Tax=Sporormia fimetaria CBS 119925 TaxID=1340428 RepID=A0A6A6VGG4_9PLEO|nr:hypothetical protein M011DRAFT_340423 [Sporormia fimetaria CBS 119925]